MRYTTQVISYSTSSTTAKELSLILRQSTEGPELDIVYNFYEEHLKDFQAECDLAVFVEPRLDSGFPDMVVVFWNRELASQWPHSRRLLLRSDILLVHHVNLTKTLSFDSLTNRMGKKKAMDAIARLDAAGVVEVTNHELVRKPLDEIFAINRLIAIEAKVKDWRKGVDQAFRNTWFASESYVLLGHIPQSQPLLDHAEKLGIGILDSNHSLTEPYMPSVIGELPASYASWLFNEWVWKHELLQGN